MSEAGNEQPLQEITTITHEVQDHAVSEPSCSKSPEPASRPKCQVCYDLEHWPNLTLENYECWPQSAIAFIGFTTDWRQNFTSFVLKIPYRQLISSKCRMCVLLTSVINDVEGDRMTSDHVLTIDAVKDKPLRISYIGQDGHLQIELYRSQESEAGQVGNQLPVENFIGTAPDLRKIIDSYAAADLAKPWLSECSASHQGCGRDKSVVLPTRVIHVGTENTAPRLLEPKEGQQGRYIALSYCWGGTSLFTTTKATLPSRLAGFDLESLPKTIQDAIKFSRHLGVDYVWVDALCIIQDDLSDWRRESAKMATVYQNATLTLSATASNHADGGCFPRPDRGAYRNITHFETATGKSRNYKVRAGRHVTHWTLFGDMAFATQGSDMGVALAKIFPVLSRGWIFQERLLSTRTLHCALHEVAWECLDMNRCECSSKPFEPEGRGLPKPFYVGPQTQDMRSSASISFRALLRERNAQRRALEKKDNIDKKSENFGLSRVQDDGLHIPDGTGDFRDYLCSLQPDNQSLFSHFKNAKTVVAHTNHPGIGWYGKDTRTRRTDPQSMWLGLIESYTSRLFTVPTDRLVAFSGIAKAFESVVNEELGTYIAGTWSEFIGIHLCWGRRPGLLTFGGFGHTGGGPTWSWSSIDQPCSFFEYLHKGIIHVSFRLQRAEYTLLSEEDPTGGVCGARLTGSAPVVEGTIVLEDDLDGNANGGPISTAIRLEGSDNQFNFVSDVCQWETGSENWIKMQPDDRLAQGESVLCAMLLRNSTWLVLRKVVSAEEYQRVGIMSFGTSGRYANYFGLSHLMDRVEDKSIALV